MQSWDSCNCELGWLWLIIKLQYYSYFVVLSRPFACISFTFTRRYTGKKTPERHWVTEFNRGNIAWCSRVECWGERSVLIYSVIWKIYQSIKIFSKIHSEHTGTTTCGLQCAKGHILFRCWAEASVCFFYIHNSRFLENSPDPSRFTREYLCLTKHTLITAKYENIFFVAVVFHTLCRYSTLYYLFHLTRLNSPTLSSSSSCYKLSSRTTRIIFQKNVRKFEFQLSYPSWSLKKI